jgi:hypothetical protein
VTTSWTFASGLSATVAISALVVAYLRPPLRLLLTELCGHKDRAAFWTAFSVVAVTLVPAIFALGSWPQADPSAPSLLAIAEQVRWGMLGLAVSVIALGWILGRFIPRSPKP